MEDRELQDLQNLVSTLKNQVENQARVIDSFINKERQSQEKESELSIKDIFLSIIKGWWAVLICTFLGAFGTMGFFLLGHVPTYKANAIMYVNNSVSIASTSISISDLTASQSLVDTYSVILKTHTILDDASSQAKAMGLTNYLGEDYSYYNLIERVSLKAVNDTEVFYVSVVDEVKSNAMIIANTIAHCLENTIPTKIDGSKARIIDEAQIDDVEKIASGITQKVLIGALAGFMVACIGAFVINYLLNDTFYDSNWFSTSYPEIPLLGEVPDILGGGHSGYYSSYGSYYGYAEQNKTDKEEK